MDPDRASEETTGPPPELAHLIRLAQAVRNSQELADSASRRFIEEILTLKLTVDVLSWAMTATKTNASMDEMKVAGWILGRNRSQPPEV